MRICGLYVIGLICMILLSVSKAITIFVKRTCPKNVRLIVVCLQVEMGSLLQVAWHWNPPYLQAEPTPSHLTQTVINVCNIVQYVIECNMK